MNKASKKYGKSEEHTSELQSHLNLVCRLLLEKKNISKFYSSLTTDSDSSLAPHERATRSVCHRAACTAQIARVRCDGVASCFFFFLNTGATHASPLSPPTTLFQP